MQIALAQLAGREGDIAHNLSRTLACLRDADPETSLIVFPETHLTGFAEPGHVDDRTLTLDGDELATLITASREHDTALALGFLERDGEHVFNTTVLITPEDGIALRYRKAHLWPDERDLVAPGDSVGCVEWRGFQVGLLICYDLEFPEPARALGQLGCDLLLVTNGNMDPYGPMHARAAQARAQDNHYFVAMTNRAGADSAATMPVLMAGAAVACYSFLGFDAVTTLTEETKDPQRTLPRAILLITLIGGLIFVVVSYFVQLAAPGHDFANPDAAAYEIARNIGGDIFVSIFLIGLVVGQFASGIAAQASGARLLYAMGRDDALPKRWLGKLSHFGTPLGGLVFSGLVALLALTMDVLSAASFINFGAFLAFALVNLSVICHYYLKERRRSGLDTLWFLICPLIGLGAILWLMASLDHLAIMLGSAWLLCGLAWLTWLTRGFSRPTPELNLES